MTIEFMRDLLSKDEKITVEYKTCQHGVQEDVYETVCSFSNRYGGYIIMGAEDDGTPIGINRNMVKDMKKNFVNQLNNPDKIFPYVTTEDLRMDLMEKVRNLAKSKNPDHPWLKMSDVEILKSAGL